MHIRLYIHVHMHVHLTYIYMCIWLYIIVYHCIWLYMMYMWQVCGCECRCHAHMIYYFHFFSVFFYIVYVSFIFLFCVCARVCCVRANMYRFDPRRYVQKIIYSRLGSGMVMSISRYHWIRTSVLNVDNVTKPCKIVFDVFIISAVILCTDYCTWQVAHLRISFALTCALASLAPSGCFVGGVAFFDQFASLMLCPGCWVGECCLWEELILMHHLQLTQIVKICPRWLADLTQAPSLCIFLGDGLQVHVQASLEAVMVTFPLVFLVAIPMKLQSMDWFSGGNLWKPWFLPEHRGAFCNFSHQLILHGSFHRGCQQSGKHWPSTWPPLGITGATRVHPHRLQ